MSKNTTPISRNAKHILTDDEVEAIKETLLGALQSKKEIEAEKKEVANTYKTKIAEQELAIDKASNLLRVGYEHRPFQCYLVKNFETGKREYIEFGTEKLIDSEPLNAADYQTEMQMAEDAIKANNQTADQLQEVIEEKVEEAGLHVVTFDEDMAEHLSPEEIAIAEAGPEVQHEIIQDTPKKGGKKETPIIIPPANEFQGSPFEDEPNDEDDIFNFDDI